MRQAVDVWRSRAATLLRLSPSPNEWWRAGLHELLKALAWNWDSGVIVRRQLRIRVGEFGHFETQGQILQGRIAGA